MAAVYKSSQQRNVFNSVFKPVEKPSLSTSLQALQDELPTDNNAPASAEPSSNDDGSPNDVRERAARQRSWQILTDALRFDDTISVGSSAQSSLSPDASRALQHLFAQSGQLDLTSAYANLTEWFIQQIRTHFLRVMKPWLAFQPAEDVQESLVKITLDGLQWARNLYEDKCSSLVEILSELGLKEAITLETSVDLEFKILARNSIPDTTWDMIEWYLSQSINAVLSTLSGFGGTSMPDGTAGGHRANLENFIQTLMISGLAGERFEIMVAEVISAAMSAHIQNTYAQVWGRSADNHTESFDMMSFGAQRQSRRFSSCSVPNENPDGLVPTVVNHVYASQCVQDVCTWIESQYSALALRILDTTNRNSTSRSDIQYWKEIGIGRLADLRVTELFDVVVGWPNNQGALDDLRTAVTTPQDRLHLTETFIQQLKDRLLHAGSSTLQILRTFLAVIRSFHALDQSKVLLDRVSFPLQTYLRSREDTAQVIIKGLLADISDDKDAPVQPDADKLNELASLLHRGPGADDTDDDDSEWLDLTWTPDPVDAGPGYKRSKRVDVIGTLITVLGSRDLFSKEFKSILAENLLQPRIDFYNENAVLGLLKKRFGDDALQAHAVMMKDIHDSSQLDDAIRSNEQLKEVDSSSPNIHTKMLSRFFWPEFDNKKHKVPEVISRRLARYQAGYEKLRRARKLAWLPNSGQALVELELEDRLYRRLVDLPQASVIYAFHRETQSPLPLVRRFNWLRDTLEMEEGLLRSVLKFWMDEQVLYQMQPNNYAVLERLDIVRRTEFSDGSAEDDVGEESTIVESEIHKYWNSINAMLTNSAPQMPVSQIARMLKMLTMDNFPHSEQELTEYLNSRVEAGDLELRAGKYKLVRR